MEKSKLSNRKLKAQRFQRPKLGDQPGTGWGKVAGWYDEVLKEEGSYQRDLILPNLLRLMDIKRGETVLDLACGQGFFAERFSRLGAKVIGTDIARELIEIAKKNPALEKAMLTVAPADKMPFVADHSVDKIAIVLALQNIENVKEVFAECARVLKPKGKLFMILNHPAFRVLKESSWGNDPATKVQYRRIDRYLSEARVKVAMHPGNKPGLMTVSFHRPFQFFFKALAKTGFVVSGLEEWSSNKQSQPGPRAEAENRARKEIPLFLYLEATKP